MAITFMNGNLKMGAWNADWPYDSCTKKDVEACKLAVDEALLKLKAIKDGQSLISKIEKLSFEIDLIPTTGDGAFLPVYNGNISGCVPHPRIGDKLAAIIIWDYSKSFTPDKRTVEGEKAGAFPPWVILAHELWHCIQMEEAGGKGGALKWHQGYQAGMEAVEQDNICRHETPFVISLGLPKRVRYSPA